MSKFAKLENKLSHKKGITNPAALAAHIGDEKYGVESMAKKAAASRRQNRDKKLHSRKRH